MTPVEKLTRLILEVPPITVQCVGRAQGKRYYTARHIAEQLIKGGVTVPPCKVGDTVYQTDGEKIYKLTVRGVIYNTDAIGFDERAIGKSVFLAEKDAEIAKLRMQKSEE